MNDKMNGKGQERKRSWPTEFVYRYCGGDTIIFCQDRENRTQDLPNTSKACKLFGKFGISKKNSGNGVSEGINPKF